MDWLKQRTAEYRTSYRRTTKDGIAALSHLNRQNTFLRYSTFNIPDSIFAFLFIFENNCNVTQAKASFPIRLDARDLGLRLV